MKVLTVVHSSMPFGQAAPFDVVIPEYNAVSGVILADQVKSLDWRKRRARHICTLSAEIQQQVLDKVATLIR